ncbi:hypothetical protein KW787_01200 [Candidatus Pacearchaeota archaeon]|nr:hypothetical protein [Candidatus Pacearchaeota archaeon]
MKRAGAAALIVVCSLLCVSLASAFWPFDKFTGFALFSHKAGPIEKQLSDLGITKEQLTAIIGEDHESDTGGFDVWDPADVSEWTNAKNPKHYFAKCTGEKETLKLSGKSIEVSDTIELPGQEYTEGIYSRTFSAKQLGSGFCIKQKITSFNPKKTATSARWVSIDGYPQLDIRYPFVGSDASYTETSECSDSDQGINFHKAGAIKSVRPGSPVRYIGDYCDGDTIVESLCQRQSVEHGDGYAAQFSAVVGIHVGPGHCVATEATIDGKKVKSAKWVDEREASADKPVKLIFTSPDWNGQDVTIGGRRYSVGLSPLSSGSVTVGVSTGVGLAEVSDDKEIKIGSTQVVNGLTISVLNISETDSGTTIIIKVGGNAPSTPSTNPSSTGSTTTKNTTTATNTPTTTKPSTSPPPSRCNGYTAKESCIGPGNIDVAKLGQRWDDFGCGKNVLGKFIQCGCYWEQASLIDSSPHCTTGPATSATNFKAWFQVDDKQNCIEKVGTVNLRIEGSVAKCACPSDTIQTLAPGKGGYYLCLKR